MPQARELLAPVGYGSDWRCGGRRDGRHARLLGRDATANQRKLLNQLFSGIIVLCGLSAVFRVSRQVALMALCPYGMGVSVRSLSSVYVGRASRCPRCVAPAVTRGQYVAHPTSSRRNSAVARPPKSYPSPPPSPARGEGPSRSDAVDTGPTSQCENTHFPATNLRP